MRVSRTIVNFWLDVTLLLTFLAILWSSFVIRFLFPSGTTAHGWILWRYSYDQWCDLQFSLICVLAFEVLLHVMLHWTWVCGVVTGSLLPRRDGAKRIWDDGVRTLVGVGLLIVLLNGLAIAFVVAMLTVQEPL